MASRNPLGKIKDLTKGAASVGIHVAGQATRTATSLTSGAVGKLAGSGKPDVPARDEAEEPTPDAPESRATEAPTKRKTPTKRKAPTKVSATEPVNVTEELGLDPAPVAEPQGATGQPDTDEPVTSIDAKADTEHVEATPADLAKAVAKKAPARKAAAKKTPAAKKAPAKKTAPGAKLPPRKQAEQAEATADQAR